MNKKKSMRLVIVILSVIFVIGLKSIIQREDIQYATQFHIDGFRRSLDFKELPQSAITVFFQEPFCQCEGEKEYVSGHTINAYNSAVQYLFRHCREEHKDKILTIYIDVYKLNNEGYTNYLALKEDLGIESIPFIMLTNKDGLMERVIEGPFEVEQVNIVVDETLGNTRK